MMEDDIIIDDTDIGSSDEIPYNDPPVDDTQLDDTHHDRISKLAIELKPSASKTEQILKAHILGLVTALGGISQTADSSAVQYELGDNALACLKDLKRWLRTFDDNNNSWDVAAACAEAGLVCNNLIVILCQWEIHNENKSVKRSMYMDKIALACLELLVPLTWPLEISQNSSINQVRHYHDLKSSQLIYKKSILSYNDGKTSKAILRIAFPIIAKNKKDRLPRDNAILRLCILFFRNIVAIAPAEISVSAKKVSKLQNVTNNMPNEVSPEDVSISSVLLSLEKNRVLLFIQTMCASLGEEFEAELFSTCCLEVIYELSKGIEVEQLYPKSDEMGSLTTMSSAASLDLKDLLKKESFLRQKMNNNTATRHGRFGGLLSLETRDNGRYTISGLKALNSDANPLDEIDKTKVWRIRKYNRDDSDDFITKDKILTKEGIAVMKKFSENFLDGCFNPLIKSVARGRESDLPATISAMYLLTIAWFLRLERERRTFYKKINVMDYGLIASALTETNFIMYSKSMREFYELKSWSGLQTAMICYREVLHTTNMMQISQNEDDRDMAIGIISRLFYEPEYLNILVQIPKIANKHSAKFLDVSIELVHIVLKLLEQFSKNDFKLFIRSKRRQRKKRAENDENVYNDKADYANQDAINDSDEEKDNHFDGRELIFSDFEERFFNPLVIDAYITYLSRFEELSHQQIKRCLSFFHRIFVKRKDHRILLMRLDLLTLFHKLASDLPKSTIKTEVENFIKYYMKKFRACLKDTPSLFVEMLFSKRESKYSFYLNNGEPEKQKAEKKQAPKVAIGLEFAESFTLKDKYKVIIAALIDLDGRDLVEWVADELKRIIEERLSEAAQRIINGANDENAQAADFDSNSIFYRIIAQNERQSKSLINNPHLRLLLEIIGFELAEISAEECQIGPEISTDDIATSEEYIRYFMDHESEFDEGKVASDFIRRKDTSREEDDGYNNGAEYSSDEEIAFEIDAYGRDNNYFGQLDDLDELESRIDSQQPRGQARVKNKKSGPRKKSTGPNPNIRPRAPKPRHRSLPLHDISEDEGKSKTPEPQGFKSSKYINDSDDDSDDETYADFFAREEALRTILKANDGKLTESDKVSFLRSWKDLGSSSDNAKVQSSDILNANSLFVDDISDDNREDPRRKATEQELAGIGYISPQKKDKVVDIFSSDRYESDNQSNLFSEKRSRIITDSDDELDTIVSKKHKPTVLDSDLDSDSNEGFGMDEAEDKENIAPAEEYEAEDKENVAPIEEGELFADDESEQDMGSPTARKRVGSRKF